MQQASTPLSNAFVKAYKATLLKLHATHLGGEESTAVDARILDRGSRLRSDINVHRAFANLHRYLLALDLKELWAASKQGAKERLCRPAPAPTLTHVTQPQQQAAAAEQNSSKQLGDILGQDGYLRTSLIYILAKASHSFMHSLNTTEVHGAEVMERALHRPQGQALITVCNHVAAMDDPLVLATVVPPSYFHQPENIRWTLCATDRCFKYAGLSALFTAAKVLPIQRGGGMQQPGMQAAEDRLKHGDWVHIFPEGTRSQGGGKMGPVRKGIGRLVAACEQPPMLVPFVHSGMEEVMPRGKVLPLLGKTVRVLVGEPIPVQDLLDKALRLEWSDDQLHSAVASRVSTHLHALKARLDAAQLGAHISSALEPAAPPGAAAEPLSGLDLYDEADLRWHHRATVWEKIKFRMQHRRWLLEGAGVGPARFAQQRGAEAGAGGSSQSMALTSASAAAAATQAAVGGAEAASRLHGIAAAISAAAAARSAPSPELHGSGSTSVWSAIKSLASSAEDPSSLLSFARGRRGEGAAPSPPPSALGELGLYAKRRVDRMSELLQYAAHPPAPSIS